MKIRINDGDSTFLFTGEQLPNNIVNFKMTVEAVQDLVTYIRGTGAQVILEQDASTIYE